jgi:hypothetical protein
VVRSGCFFRFFRSECNAFEGLLRVVPRFIMSPAGVRATDAGNAGRARVFRTGTPWQSERSGHRIPPMPRRLTHDPSQASRDGSDCRPSNAQRLRCPEQACNGSRGDDSGGYGISPPLIRAMAAVSRHPSDSVADKTLRGRDSLNSLLGQASNHHGPAAERQVFAACSDRAGTN